MKASFSLSILSFLILAGFTLTGCKDQPGIANFPHNIHVEQEITCDTCHELNDDQVTLPAMDSCLTCHEADSDTLSRCTECHQQHNVQPAGESVVSHQSLLKPLMPKDWADVKFNHAQYLENDQETCFGCHAGVKDSDKSTLSNLPSMETSMDFNEVHGISNECAVCHTEVDRLNPPASHNASWAQKHGMMEPFMDKDRCLLCHEEATCTTCHRIEQPKSHTNLWRRRTHGIQASFDRGRCLVCHRNDECMSCHRNAADRIPPAHYHQPGVQCVICHAPQGAIRQPSSPVKMMPHRMMMGSSSAKCLECHSF
ncbi:MAG: hypothetical protein RBU29_16555 [bacterium]|jgi:hypothetical protein|nr:hypothetical protein [bacterium]